MISNYLAKGDPRLARLFPDTKQEPGYAGAAYNGQVEVRSATVLVSVYGDRVPHGFEKLSWRHLARGIFSVAVTQDEYRALINCEDVERIHPPQPMRRALDKSAPAINMPEVHEPEDQSPGHKGKGVVIGIIDHGFDLTHPDFRDDDGKTRIAFFLDQTQEGEVEVTKGLSISGVEHTAKDIDDALQYSHARALEILKHTPQPAAHGTHVAGIAAGNGKACGERVPRYLGMAPEATLICVNLPVSTDDSLIGQALKYIFTRAAEGMKEPSFLDRFSRKKP
ncbi:MAG TPA: S8 family serine peptidase, partial [Vicinamibacterales bacterium]